MPLLDLVPQKHTSTATLAKVAIRRDPDGVPPDDLLYDLELAYVVDSKDPVELAALDSLCPGAAAQAAAGVARQASGTLGYSEDWGERYATVDVPGVGNAFWQRRAEVRGVKARTVSSITTATLRLRVRGLDAYDASRLVRYLEKQVDLTMERAQQSLPLQAAQASTAGRPAPRGRAWDGALGSVVAGQYVLPTNERRSASGVVVASDVGDDKIVRLQVEDVVAGTSCWICESDVSSCVKVVGPGGADVRDQLASYVSLAEAAGVPASWDHLVTSLGMAYAEARLSADAEGRWVVDDAVLQGALSLGRPAGAT